MLKSTHEFEWPKWCKKLCQLRFPVFSSLFVGMCFMCPKSNAQNIDSPRFFEINFQPRSAGSTPFSGNQATSPLFPNHYQDYLIDAELKFPVKLKGKTKIIGELEYKNEFVSGLYSFEENEVEHFEFTQAEVSLIAATDFNEKTRLINMINVKNNSSDIFSMNRQMMRFQYTGLLEKNTDKGSFGFGTRISVGERTRILPVLKYETTFSNDWDMAIILPSKVMFSKKFTNDTRWTFGAKLSRSNYSLAEHSLWSEHEVDTRYRRMSIDGLVRYERQLTDWVGLSLEVGASAPFKAGIYEDNDNRVELHNFNQGISPYFNVGFFLAFPGKVIQ